MKLRKGPGSYTFLMQTGVWMISTRIASITTHISNPALVAAYTFILLLYTQNVASPAFVGIVLAFGTFIPLLIIYLLSKRGFVSDLFVTHREERAKPFVGAVASYVVGSLALWLLRAPKIVTALMLCYAVNTVIMMLITRRWKISVHASGIAGPTTVLIRGLGAWAIIFFAFLVPVGWARLRLRAHTPTQFLAGALVTIAATWAGLAIYLAVL